MISAGEARRLRGVRPARWLAWFLVVLGLLALLAAPLAGAFGHRFAVISGGSMAPTMHAGDVLLLGPVPATLQVGDLAVVGHGTTAYVHRIIQAEEGSYVLQGDANAEPDLRRVAHDDITGEVALQISAPLALPAAAAVRTDGKIAIALASIALVVWATLSGRAPAARAAE